MATVILISDFRLDYGTFFSSVKGDVYDIISGGLHPGSESCHLAD